MTNWYLLERASTDLDGKLITHFINPNHTRDSSRDFHVVWYPKHLALAVKNELMALSMQQGTMEQRIVEAWSRFKRSIGFFQTLLGMQKARARQAQRQLELEEKRLASGCD